MRNWIRRWSHFSTSASWTVFSWMLEKPRSSRGCMPTPDTVEAETSKSLAIRGLGRVVGRLDDGWWKLTQRWLEDAVRLLEVVCSAHTGDAKETRQLVWETRGQIVASVRPSCHGPWIGPSVKPHLGLDEFAVSPFCAQGPHVWQCVRSSDLLASQHWTEAKSALCTAL